MQRFGVRAGLAFGGLLLAGMAAPAMASTYDDIGVTAIRAADATLTGTGVYVGQPEAGTYPSYPPPDYTTDNFEVNPAAVGKTASLFTYISSFGSAAGTYPNTIGTESGHADAVANNFYGSGGVAPGVLHVDNYDANYFYNSLIATASAISPKVVNQSLSFGSQNTTVDQRYDNYVALNHTIFVSAVGNSTSNQTAAGKPTSPGTAYNSIGVAAYGGDTAVGPTTDGRSKPDITAPESATSYSTALVSGTAAVLYQAASRGDGGSGTSATAIDDRVIKSLLLNGATHPAGWTHTSTAPLDPNYGAGIVNVYNSWRQLQGGKEVLSSNTSTSSLGGTHPGLTGTSEASNVGWNLGSLTSSTNADAVDHYFFNITSASDLTSTLTWERQNTKSSINNLDLYLYNGDTGLVVASSVSPIDNVEYLSLTNLAPGHYDLQVLKNGGNVTQVVTNAETYGLAFSFAAVPEPSGLALAVIGFSLLLRRSQRRRAA
jgi:hypothetical protein